VISTSAVWAETVRASSTMVQTADRVLMRKILTGMERRAGPFDFAQGGLRYAQR
jgi:hypothetical protein